MNIYCQDLMDHYNYPRNRTLLSSCSFSSDQYNRSCGDQVTIQGIVEGNRITGLYFQGDGCVISQATASMLTEACIDKSPQTVLTWSEEVVLKLVGIPLGLTRRQCALLPLRAIQKGLASYLTQDDTNA